MVAVVVVVVVDVVVVVVVAEVVEVVRGASEMHIDTVRDSSNCSRLRHINPTNTHTQPCKEISRFVPADAGQVR